MLVLFSFANCPKKDRCSNSHPSNGDDSMKKPTLKLVSPATKNRTVTPRRRPNADLPTREYLTDAEAAIFSSQLERPLLAERGKHIDRTDPCSLSA
jgi:hypothetical protein